jgi:hypothetical protein
MIDLIRSEFAVDELANFEKFCNDISMLSATIVNSTALPKVDFLPLA